MQNNLHFHHDTKNISRSESILILSGPQSSVLPVAVE